MTKQIERKITAPGVKYWEQEEPVIIEGTKSVAKVYVEHGKIQAFPKVASARYGIGKGATLDLETMEIEALLEMQKAVNRAIEIQVNGGEA